MQLWFSLYVIKKALLSFQMVKFFHEIKQTTLTFCTKYRGVYFQELGGGGDENSVSDPYHFDSDPDPRIRIRDDGSGS